MYGILKHSAWKQIKDGRWLLVCNGVNTGQAVIDSDTINLVLAKLEQITSQQGTYWSGIIPPRTTTHLPLRTSLEESMKDALAYLANREGILARLTLDVPIDQNRMPSIRYYRMPTNLV